MFIAFKTLNPARIMKKSNIKVTIPGLIELDFEINDASRSTPPWPYMIPKHKPNTNSNNHAAN